MQNTGTLELSSILQSIQGSKTEKVASEKGSKDAREELLAAINKSSEQEKVASEQGYYEDPSDTLVKMAEDMNALEAEMLEKQANFYGAAVCDGFMARLSEYESAAEEIPGGYEKQASYDDSDYEFEKNAADAFEAGYNDVMEKIAEEAMMIGYTDAMEKVASDVYSYGYADTMNVLDQL